LRPIFKNFLGPSVILGMGEAKHSKFGVKIDTDEYWRVHDRLPPNRCFWEITDNISEIVQDR